MTVKNIILSAFLGLAFVSCDSTLMIKVGLEEELSDQDYSLVDYDFILADSGTSDKLYFEFIVNKELGQEATVTFFDRSGAVIAAMPVGEPGTLNSNTDERSLIYSVSLDNLRSESLVSEVLIANQ